MIEIDNLNVVDYWQYRRDAFIHECNQTEAGQEYLENAYMLQQTEPDREQLRSLFGSERG